MDSERRDKYREAKADCVSCRDRPNGVPHRRVSVIVWEGAARSGTNASGGLQTLVTQSGFEERFLLTR
jgi:hypothetical protein